MLRLSCGKMETEKEQFISIVITLEKQNVPYPEPQINELQNRTFRRRLILEFLI